MYREIVSLEIPEYGLGVKTVKIENLVRLLKIRETSIYFNTVRRRTISYESKKKKNVALHMVLGSYRVAYHIVSPYFVLILVFFYTSTFV